jgi:hypothetical protein
VTRTRKPLKPVTVTCRWLPDEVTGQPRLEINGRAYELVELAGGFRLFSWDGPGSEIKVYDICTTEPWGWTCDCPDCTYRQRECKHLRALKAALAVRQAA